MPKISVIMGVYNGSSCVDDAIESLCRQTFIDWELIVCDDCSTDESYQKLLSWKKKDSRIKVLHNSENLKLAKTLNICFDQASGDYIARMDDDDFSYPNRFEKQLSFLEEHTEYAFVSSVVDCYNGKEIVKNRFYRKAEPQKKDFLHGTQFVHPATMFRRTCLEAADGYCTDKSRVRTEDYDLFMRLYAMGYYGYNIQEPLLRYHVSVSDMKTKRQYRYRVNEARVRYRGFKKMGLLPKGWIYVFRPLIVGLIPHKLIWLMVYRKKQEKERPNE